MGQIYSIFDPTPSCLRNSTMLELANSAYEDNRNLVPSCPKVPNSLEIEGFNSKKGLSSSRQAFKGKSKSMHYDVLEEQIILVAKERDRAAFGQIYEFYAPRIKSYLLKMTVSSQQADDLLQEVMIIVWRKAHLYDPQKARLSTWLFRIARNKFIDGTRRQKYQEVDVDDHLKDTPSDDQTDRPVIALQESRIIRSALGSLKGDLRIVIEKSFLEELSHSEIAAELGLPLGTVKSRIRIAFQKMRLMLGEKQ